MGKKKAIKENKHLGVLPSTIATFMGLGALVPGGLLIYFLALKFQSIGFKIGLIITIAYMIPVSIKIYKWAIAFEY